MAGWRGDGGERGAVNQAENLFAGPAMPRKMIRVGIDLLKELNGEAKRKGLA